MRNDPGITRTPTKVSQVGSSKSEGITNLARDISQGNPGALNVVTKILNAEGANGLTSLRQLNDLGIRGPKLWVAYKQFANMDLTVLLCKN